MAPKVGSAPTTSTLTGSRTANCATWELVGSEGLEPSTYSLKGSYSTIEL